MYRHLDTSQFFKQNCIKQIKKTMAYLVKFLLAALICFHHCCYYVYMQIYTFLSFLTKFHHYSINVLFYLMQFNHTAIFNHFSLIFLPLLNVCFFMRNVSFSGLVTKKCTRMSYISTATIPLPCAVKADTSIRISLFEYFSILTFPFQIKRDDHSSLKHANAVEE